MQIQMFFPVTWELSGLCDILTISSDILHLSLTFPTVPMPQNWQPLINIHTSKHHSMGYINHLCAALFPKVFNTQMSGGQKAHEKYMSTIHKIIRWTSMPLNLIYNLRSNAHEESRKGQDKKVMRLWLLHSVRQGGGQWAMILLACVLWMWQEVNRAKEGGKRAKWERRKKWKGTLLDESQGTLHCKLFSCETHYWRE